MPKKWKYEDIVKYVKNKGGTVLTTKEEYKNTRTNMDFTCNICGEKITRTFKSYRDQKAFSCRECTNKKLREDRRLSQDEVFARCNKFGAKLITPYKLYKNNETNMELECSCGNHFTRRLADLQSETDYRCTFCSNHHKYTLEEVKSFIENKGCKLLSEVYNNNSELLEIQCKCGNVFYRRFGNFKDSEQYYCNDCISISKGEEKIKSILDELNINYERGYRFEDCKNIKSLPFDFYIYSLNITIEYDGKQHYKVGCFNMTLLDLMNLKRRDNIKTQYCKDNNIKLIRIPYWDYNNIKDIICQELK